MMDKKKLNMVSMQLSAVSEYLWTISDFIRSQITDSEYPRVEDGILAQLDELAGKACELGENISTLVRESP